MEASESFDWDVQKRLIQADCWGKNARARDFYDIRRELLAALELIF